MTSTLPRRSAFKPYRTYTSSSYEAYAAEDPKPYGPLPSEERQEPQ